MIRRAIWGIGGLALLMTFFFGRDASSYVRTSAGWVKQSVKNCVPIPFEIDRARKMVKNLAPDIQRNMHVIAQEEVEVDRLQKQIAEKEKTLGKDRQHLTTLKDDLTTKKSLYQYAGRSYSEQQVKVDLANRFERYKTADATLNSLRDILSARQRSLAAAREKLEGMLAVKRQLEVQVENLEARLKMVEVAQTTSEYNFDDSQLARAKDVIGEVQTRLQVCEKLVNAETQMHDEIPLDAPAPENILEQVTDYLTPSTSTVADLK